MLQASSFASHCRGNFYRAELPEIQSGTDCGRPATALRAAQQQRWDLRDALDRLEDSELLLRG